MAPRAAMLLLLVLLLATALARPALPEDELAVLEKDLEEDLEDLEDARAVDAAYESLFDNGVQAASPPPVHEAPPQDLLDVEAAGAAGTPPGLSDYDYQGDQPHGPQGDDEDRPTSYKLGEPAHRAVPAAEENLTVASTASSGTPTTPGRNVSDLKQERESVESSSMERAKASQLQHIHDHVLRILGLSHDSQLNKSAPSPDEALVRVVGRIGPMGLPGIQPHQDISAQKVQSHFPSCSLPRNTDEALWTGGSDMHLMFDLPNLTPGPGTSVNVVQATLRLYKLSQGNAPPAARGPLCLTPHAAHAPASHEDGMAADAPPSADTNQDDDGLQGPLHALLGTAAAADDRVVRVSVYWYTRSLKKNKNGAAVERRKLLDSRMLPVHGSAWTEWSVRTAVKVWQQSGRNFGLVVQVEDVDGTPLDASQYFNGMNCTQEASTARPLPSFLVDRYHSNAPGRSAAASGPYAHALNQNLFPVIDLCTVATTDGGAVSGAAPCLSGYDFPGASGARLQRAHQQTRHWPQHLAAKQKPAPRPSHASPHKHRHQHDAVEEFEDGDTVEPVARRWPRARSVQQDGPVDDIRSLIIPQRIILAARHHVDSRVESR